MKNTKQTLVLLALTSLSLFPLASRAGDTSTGCGLGWSVTKSMTTTAASTRPTTNATGSQTIAMTFGTSGCAKHSIVLNEKMDHHFTEANLEFLAAEAAIGNGELLSNWARTQGCNDSVQGVFGAEVQKNYGELFGRGQNADQSLYNLKKVIKSNSTLTKNCKFNS